MPVPPRAGAAPAAGPGPGGAGLLELLLELLVLLVLPGTDPQPGTALLEGLSCLPEFPGNSAPVEQRGSQGLSAWFCWNSLLQPPWSGCGCRGGVSEMCQCCCRRPQNTELSVTPKRLTAPRGSSKSDSVIKPAGML